MKRSLAWLPIVAVAAVVLAAGGCSLETLDRGGTATASLVVSMKQPAAPVASIAVVVTAPDMNPIALTVPADQSQITVEVPAGFGRTFSVLVNTVSVTFQGSARVDLLAGQTTTVTLEPRLSATQIIVPDANNNRIVQFADMLGTGWTPRTGTQIGFLDDWELRPWDIDFDARGRIYIANENSNAGIIRLDDINDTAYENITGGVYSANTLAIDRARNLLYFCGEWDEDTIFRVDLSSPGPPFAVTAIDLAIEGMNYRRTLGLAVDSSGYLYYADRSNDVVEKFDLTRAPGSRLIADYGGLSSVNDVLIKEPHVYLADDSADGFLVRRLDMNLALLDAFGSLADPPLEPGQFWGPRRFVAILNRKIHLLDEGYNSGTFNEDNRIVAFDEIGGAGWATFGQYGNSAAVGDFDFPYYGGC